MLTVHHLGVSQSDRIVWLCEELELCYNLQIHKRDPLLSPQSIKDLHPLGAAPIIQDGDITLAETAACAEYIIHKHGNGRLALGPNHANYANYLYWFHFSNGTLQPGVGRIFTLNQAKVDPSSEVYGRVKGRVDGYHKFLDDHLKNNTWLVGDEFTAADVMIIFPLTTMRTFSSYDLSPYPNILAYLRRATERPAYIKAHDKADPKLPIMIEGPPPAKFLELRL